MAEAQPISASAQPAMPESIGGPISQPASPRPAADRLAQLEASGPGVSHHHGIGGGILKTLDAVGGAIVPNAMQQIPGTTLNYQQKQIPLAESEATAENQGIASQGAEQENQARIDLQRAQAEKALRPPQLTPKEEQWTTIPGFTGPNGEPVQQEKNSGQIRIAQAPGVASVDKHTAPETKEITRVVGGVPHTIMVNSRTGEDIKDEGQTKIPGEAPAEKRSASEQAQVEREARGAIRKAEEGYRDTQKSVGQLTTSIDAASDGNGLLTSFVPTMAVLGINTSNGVHRISPAEAQAAQLPGGWAEQFNAWFDKATSGKLTPQLKQEGKQLAKILTQSAHQKYQSIYEDEAGIVEGYGGKGFRDRVKPIPGPSDSETKASAPPRDAKPGMKWQQNKKTGEFREVPAGG
jgi:hypothetical protein